MKLVKVVKSSTYVGKNGKEYRNINYYISLDNGKWIPIKPSFPRGYSELDVVAEVIKEK